MTREEFQNDIRAGIPDRLPAAKNGLNTIRGLRAANSARLF